MRRLQPQRIFTSLSFVLPAVVAGAMVGTLRCAGGSNDKVADSGTASSGDDDTEVSQAVPMALLGNDYLAQVTSKFGTSASTNNDVPPASGSQSPGADNYALAKGTLEASARATGQTKILLDGVQGILDSIFGADGYFRGKDVTLKKDQTERLFKVEGDGDIRFIVVRVNGDDAAYKFGVDLFRKAAGGVSEMATRIDFTPRENGTAAVAVEHAGAVTNGSTQRVQATYDTATMQVTTVYGNEPAAADSPAKTMIHVNFDADNSTLDVRGGYVWERAAVTPTLAVPRYYLPVTGDIELFSLRARKNGAQESVQKLAFIPANAAAAVGDDPGKAVFNGRDYAALVKSYLLNVLRKPTLNSGCATTGDDLRAAYASGAPASVTSLPSDICNTNTALTDADLWAGVDAICKSTTTTEVTLQVYAPETQTADVASLGVCAIHYEGVLLANPQYFKVSGNSRALVQSAAEVTAAMTALRKELDKQPFESIASLQDRSWPSIGSRSANDFISAENRPE